MTNDDSSALAHETPRASLRWRALPALSLALASIIASAASCKGSTDDPPSCAGSLQIGVTDIFGGSLPRKTVALTFDDGPGPRTAELSTYLKNEGIQTIFFVNGARVPKDGPGARILQQIVDDGHILGNHTQTHTSLTGRSTGGKHLDPERVVAELAETDAIIAPFVAESRFVFRAPFGDFDEQTFQAVNASPMKKYVGPVNWDIGDHMGEKQAVDWDCWQRGSDGKILTVQECGELYAAEIRAVGRGIVLMHDPYFIDDDPAKGGTVDMVQYLVPILKAEGYSFVRLDQVPDIDKLLPALPSDAGASDAGQGGFDATSPSGEPGAPPPASDPPPAGGNAEPCPPSPQESRPASGGESGNLRIPK